MIIFAPKRPGATEKFGFDFTKRLGADTIASAVLTADGVTLASQVDNDTTVDFELSGGTEGTVATVECVAVSSGGETLDELAVVPIGGEALSLDLAKASQRIETTDEDPLLTLFLRAALGAVESQTSKNLTAKVESQVLDGFPHDRRHQCTIHMQGQLTVGGSAPIRLFKGPVSSILELAYDDQDGNEQTLTSFRLVDGGRGQALLLPAYGACWPATARGPGTVRLSYVAGYEPAALPPELVQAATWLFGHFNANREAVNADTRAAAVELPLGVQMLLDDYRVPGIA